MEATPNYLAYPGAATRLSELLPEAKLIVLLRDPVERTFSSWKLRVEDEEESRSFEDAIDSELSDAEWSPDADPAEKWEVAKRLRFAHVGKSRYADHLRSWFGAFDRSQFLILQSERLFEAPRASLHRIEDFLGVPRDQSIYLPRFNPTTASSVPPSPRAKLLDYFAHHNDALETLTGQRFDWA
jgi:hypothetical protein